jgi:hypothetical protein
MHHLLGEFLPHSLAYQQNQLPPHQPQQRLLAHFLFSHLGSAYKETQNLWIKLESCYRKA